MKALRLLLLGLLAMLPSKIKILVLRLLGAKIGRGCHIGVSIVEAKDIRIGSYVRIGNCNLIKGLRKLELQDGSKIESLNWITGAGTGSLRMGKNSSIRRLHFLEASANVTIGANTIIAGRSSLFFTHGLAPDNLDDMRPIVIGDWCYIGSAVRFLPGASVATGTFVAMGAVVTKAYTDEYSMIGGVPAKRIKRLSKSMKYFNRAMLPHAHHPASYVK